MPRATRSFARGVAEQAPAARRREGSEGGAKEKGPRGRHGRRRAGLAARLLLLTAPCVVACAWALFVVVRVEAAGARDDARPADAAVVLGAAQYGGWPSPVFRARLDHAQGLYEEGRVPLIVVVGGSRGGESPTEAGAGVRYLEGRGVPDDALLAVERGDSTYSSLRAVRDRAERADLRSVLLVSDRFHMLRSLRMADDLGMVAHGSPTATSPIESAPSSELRFALREVAAYTAYAAAGVFSYADPGNGRARS